MDQPSDNRLSGSGPIAVAIVLAALILGYTGGDEQPRYQLAASGTAVYRMNTDSGELIACTERGCARVEPPDRAKTLGAIELRLPGGRKPEPQQNAATARPQD